MTLSNRRLPVPVCILAIVALAFQSTGLILGTAQEAWAATASVVDKSFGVEGLAAEQVPGIHGGTPFMFPDGSFLLVTRGTTPQVARFDPNGRPDLAFGNHGVLAGVDNATIYPDDSFVSVSFGPSRITFSKWLKSGAPDTSFGTSGTVDMGPTSGFANIQSAQPNGGVVYGTGTAWQRLDSRGIRDTAFGVNGSLAISQTMLALSGGTFVTSDIAPPTQRFLFLHGYDSEGHPNVGFGIGGLLSIPLDNRPSGPFPSAYHPMLRLLASETDGGFRVLAGLDDNCNSSMTVIGFFDKLGQPTGPGLHLGSFDQVQCNLAETLISNIQRLPNSDVLLTVTRAVINLGLQIDYETLNNSLTLCYCGSFAAGPDGTLYLFDPAHVHVYSPQGTELSSLGGDIPGLTYAFGDTVGFAVQPGRGIIITSGLVGSDGAGAVRLSFQGAPPPPPSGHLLGLGDSVAAGLGLGTSDGTTTTSPYGDNPNAFPALIAAQKGWTYQNLAIGGACAAKATDPGADPNTPRPTPTDDKRCITSVIGDELSKPISSAPDEIVIQVGANDIKFSVCAQALLIGGDNPCAGQPFHSNLRALKQNLSLALSRLKAKFPSAKVVVGQYYNPLPRGIDPVCDAETISFIDQKIVQYLNGALLGSLTPLVFRALAFQAHLYHEAGKIVNQLNDAIAKTAKTAGVTTTAVPDFSGHDVCHSYASQPSDAWLFAPEIHATINIRSGIAPLGSISVNLVGSNSAINPSNLNPPAQHLADRHYAHAFKKAGVSRTVTADVTNFAVRQNEVPHPTALGQAALARGFIAAGG